MEVAVILTWAGMLIASLLNTPDTTIILAENQPKENSAIIIKTDAGSVRVDKPLTYVTLSSKEEMPSIPKEISKEDVAKKFKSAINITPEKPIRILLFFKSGGSELTQESKEKLPYILESVQKRSPCDVSIIGHTDTVGSEELNIELSLSRANYVLGWIKSHNISLLKTDIKSHGESDLLIKTADNIPEEKNRRVEILIR